VTPREGRRSSPRIHAWKLGHREQLQDSELTLFSAAFLESRRNRGLAIGGTWSGFGAAGRQIFQRAGKGNMSIILKAIGMGGTNFDVVADASKSPKTLEVLEPRIGCRWIAVTS
jgi:hypothetical protein